jgi:NAD(P)H-dependent FMN reductase/ketosteroid isomerase-like protein
MSPTLRVAVLIGSLREASLSKKIARVLIQRAPRELSCQVVEIGDLPLYNEDLEQNAPPAWQRFRRELCESDAALFVTPEYNRSVPGCLKNALDVGSRPPEKSVFDGMPAGVVSVTPYQLGAFGANHALRQTFVFLNMPVLQQPEVYVGKAAELLDDAGQLKNAKSAELFDKFLKAFAIWARQGRAAASGDFEAFLRQRQEAASAYVRGDAAPLAQLVTERDPATFFSPRGDAVQGARAVAERYTGDAKSFGQGGTTRLEILQASASGGLAYWTGLQHAELPHGGETTSMTLRVTEVYRAEAGGFKLVHRHADPAKT